MQRLVRISAIRVGNQIDLKALKGIIRHSLLADSSSELFYKSGESSYQYFFNYGVVVFSGHSEEEIRACIEQIAGCLKSPANWLRDDHEIEVLPSEPVNAAFDRVTVNKLTDGVYRVSMFVLGQSVALDHYHDVSENLLTQVRFFANDLENHGKLSISRRNMMKFIGKALNTQNDIAENIYIFDAPDLVWDDVYLDTLHQRLSKQFDLRVRFSEIEYTLRIIEDNLRVFREISHQRESSTLEWIIIALILVELMNLLISELVNK